MFGMRRREFITLRRRQPRPGPRPATRGGEPFCACVPFVVLLRLAIPAGWQSDLSFSHNNIGGVLRDQGILAAALDSHKAAQAIRERLVKPDPGSVGWQNDLAASHRSGTIKLDSIGFETFRRTGRS